MRLLSKIIFSNPVLGLLLTLLIFAASLSGCPPLQILDQQLFDQLISLRKPASSDKVVMVAIDVKSRQLIGDTPWPRQRLVQLIEAIQRQQPAAIGLVAPLSFPAADSSADSALAKQAATLVVRLEDHQGITAGNSSYFKPRSLPRIKELPPTRELLRELRNPLRPYLQQPNVPLFLPPLPALRQKLKAGPLVLSEDQDGRLRRMPLLVPWRDRLLPSLPLQLILKARGEKLQDIVYGPLEFPGNLQVGKLNFKLGPGYQLLLDRSGQHPDFQSLSASDLLQHKLPKNRLRRRIVLIGETAQRSSPSTLNDLQAASLATISLLNGTPLYQPAWGWLLETAVLLYFGLLCFLLLPRLSSRFGFCVLLFFLASWVCAAAASLVMSGLWFHVAPAIILSVLGFVLIHYKRLRYELARSVAESNKILGRTFHEQGLLDLALEHFLRCPPRDGDIKRLLYNLGLDFERKRMPHKALRVYQHLQKAGRFRDIKQRIRRLKEHDQTLAMVANDGTMLINKAGEKPMLGRYRIEKVLGQGAMGTVYLGVDPKINRQVAIKTLAYEQVETAELPAVKARFFREAEAAGRLSHPHIVTVYDVGEETDLAYMAMELLGGKALSRYCNKKNRLAPHKILEIGAQIAGALEYAHRPDVVHRDIKPANIMLAKNGQVKVADFGVARMVSSSRTETGVILGTPSYMSPEQVAGKKVDGRSDLFSLGVVFYELFSGEKPFVADSLTALMFNISNAKYQDLEEICPDLPEDCYRIVVKLLSKAPSRRYRSADLLQREILELLDRMEER
ncbi:MAG: serine/threonine-protein kinase [Geopsychrobacter sp.]|nr:serine/threonine-protein kinase [Geopsychrobacter sp.]